MSAQAPKARTPAFIPHGLKTGVFLGSIATAVTLGRSLWALFTNRPEGLNASLKFAGRSDLTAGG